MFVRNRGESLHTTRAPPRPGIAAQEPEHQRRLRRRGGHTQRMAGKQQRKSRDTRRFRYPCYPVVCVNPWSKEHGVDHQGADGTAVPVFTQVVEPDVLRRALSVWRVEQLGAAPVPVVVAALRLIGSHFGRSASASTDWSAPGQNRTLGWAAVGRVLNLRFSYV